MGTIADEVLVYCADARTATTSYVSVPRRGLVRWMLKEVDESIAIQLPSSSQLTVSRGQIQGAGSLLSLLRAASAGHGLATDEEHKEEAAEHPERRRERRQEQGYLRRAQRDLRGIPALQHRDVHILERAAAASDWSAGVLSPSGGAGGHGGASSRGSGGGGKGRRGLGLESTANEKDLREAGIRPHITARRGCIIVSMGPVAAAILSSKLLLFVGSGSDDDLRPILMKIAEVFAPAAKLGEDATNFHGVAGAAAFSFLPIHPAIVSGTFLNPQSPSFFPLLSWELYCLEMLLSATTNHYSRLVERAEETTAEVTVEATRDEELSMIKWQAFAGLAYRCLRGSARATKKILCCQCRQLCNCKKTKPAAASTTVVRAATLRTSSMATTGRSTAKKKPSGHHFTGLRWFASWLTKDSLDAASNIIRLGQAGSSLKGLRSAVQEVQRAISHVLDQQQQATSSSSTAPAVPTLSAGTHRSDRLLNNDDGIDDGSGGEFSPGVVIPSGPDGAYTTASSSSSTHHRHRHNDDEDSDGMSAAEKEEERQDEEDAASSPLSAFVFPLSRRAILQARRMARREKRKAGKTTPSGAAATAVNADNGNAAAAEEDNCGTAAGSEEAVSSLVEVLFESYLAAADSLLRRSRMLIEEVESSESHSRLLMAVSQNHIWSAQVVLSSVSMLLAAALGVAAYFGMNLGNADADFTEPYGNWLAVVLTMSSVVIVGSICAAAAIFRYLDAGGVK
jgi:hypothetical protein